MFKRILLLLVCILLLFVSWVTVLGVESAAQKQEVLIALAEGEIQNGTYINAVPYLTEAVTYTTSRTFSTLEMLKDVYRTLGDTRKYVNVLKELLVHNDCPSGVYDEYARHHIAQNRQRDALEMLRLGIVRTNDESLKEFYEEQRYAYIFKRDTYEDVTAFHNGGIQVRIDDFWGLADGSGRTIIPCAYNQISTFDATNKGSVVAIQPDQTIVTLNMKNQPIAKLNLDILRIGNLSQDIIPLQLANGKWIIADSRLVSNNEQFEDVGIAHNQTIALKTDGKWGVISLNNEIIAPFEYEAIVMDELGRCYAQNAVFVRRNGKVHLLVDGVLLPDVYEEAHPFTNEGWAAVKKNNLWGFIDTAGAFTIAPQYEEAQSFSGQLAAVKQGDFWGYISSSGKVVIEPIFLQAKNFADGNAPVLTDQGWQFISLLEYN